MSVTSEFNGRPPTSGLVALPVIFIGTLIILVSGMSSLEKPNLCLASSALIIPELTKLT